MAAAAVLLGIGWDLVRTRSPLVHRRIGLVTLGSVAGFAVPGAAMLGSAAFGGTLPINLAALTAFVFPMSLGYAVVKRDLFEIDAMLRRTITYAIMVVLIAFLYLSILLGIASLDWYRELAASSPLTLALLNLAFLLLFAPLRSRVQVAVDRVFFRQDYDPETALARLGRTLAAAYTVDDVVAKLAQTMTDTVCPATTVLYRHDSDNRFHRHGDGDEGAPILLLPPASANRLWAGEVATRYEHDDGQDTPPAPWHSISAELLVPVQSGALLVGMVAFGPRRSGRSYTIHDLAFVRAAVGQVALALQNADAFESIRRAYEKLAHNQASLIRADRLTTLGRLTAGMAHEVNTPLAAVQNSLQLLRELAAEYQSSIDDPSVGPDDHREIAAEIVATVEKASRWSAKAAAFVSKVKMHGRESGSSAEWFPVRAVVEETKALLVHRLRATGCDVTFSEEPRDVRLRGDRGRLGQVLVNLVANALDAYEERGVSGRCVDVCARGTDGVVTVTVTDEAGGIPPDVLPRIFDELFTTKDPGKGTGLGLWIARNLLEESFAGTLTVESTVGIGTCFTATLRLPEDRAPRTRAA
jgi:signal transduction histidine kinase